MCIFAFRSFVRTRITQNFKKSAILRNLVPDDRSSSRDGKGIFPGKFCKCCILMGVLRSFKVSVRDVKDSFQSCIIFHHKQRTSIETSHTSFQGDGQNKCCQKDRNSGGTPSKNFGPMEGSSQGSTS